MRKTSLTLKEGKIAPAATPSFMRRLREDKAGNTFAIAAAMMIPMVGVIGSGVDISRAYLVKTRLQQACDAGVLGGRKVMSSAGIDANVTGEVQKFVTYNFPQNTSGTSSFAITPTAGANNAINLALATSMPTELIKVLGVQNVAINVSCTARQDFVNTDVELVLDTTGSMNCDPSAAATANCPTEAAGSKIAALRSAVTAFYNALKPAQDQLESQGLRLRYGIVPFSSNVNVGKLLMDTNTAWLNRYGNYRQCASWYPGYTGVLCQTSTNPVSVDHGAVSTSTNWWNNWANTNTANGYPEACIEERQTSKTIGSSSGYTPPTTAYDLDLNMVPSGNSTSSTLNPTAWTAFDPASETAKLNNSGGFACPYPVLQLQRLSSVSAINNYTANLKAVGGTYHDIGMLWGGRMLSQTGLWASNNPTSYNSFPVNRHLIFMTDGALDPDPWVYSAYGVEQFDKRTTSSAATNYGLGSNPDSAQNATHLQRFRMICNAAKGMNINVWVIAFGTSSGTGLTTDMINCANSPAQAFKADDQAALIAKFTQIGQTIGALRLSQ